jgi:hypothetical protein
MGGYLAIINRLVIRQKTNGVFIGLLTGKYDEGWLLIDPNIHLIHRVNQASYSSQVYRFD